VKYKVGDVIIWEHYITDGTRTATITTIVDGVYFYTFKDQTKYHSNAKELDSTSYVRLYTPLEHKLDKTAFLL
jgi:hypothetical protein